MSSNYSRYSPYRNVKQTWYLGYYEPTPINSADDDEIFTITPEYAENPSKLALERYGNERLWYIFSLANMDIIIDPIYDFTVGTEIIVPSNSRIQRLLGGNF